MASKDEWRSALTATERFDNIQKIERAAHPTALTASAFTLENEAYLSSSSREDYDAACDLLSRPPTGAVSETASRAPDPDASGLLDDGVEIGPYKKCRYIASGASADVYRSGGSALKVITCGIGQPPHNAYREAKILKLLQKPCIPLLETFFDKEQQLVLVFPFMPLTLEAVLRDGKAIPKKRLQSYFADIFSALAQLHSQGIIHRDIKPSAVLLEYVDGPAYLSDFGTAWHPDLSKEEEPADEKVLDIGTGPYRAPEALFGNQSYGPSVDMWGAGAMLAECARGTPKPLFESRGAHEDGNQLGLILSIFKTIGSPTLETWPEAAFFRTPPFEMYRVFEPQTWDDILPDVDEEIRDLVPALVQYGSARLTAEQALSEIHKLDTD